MYIKAIKRHNQEIADRKEDRKIEQDTRIRISNLYQEREKNPILCKVCTKKNQKKTYFQGLSWYHCPVCNNHAFASIYGSKGECTGCSNTARFGSPLGN